MTKYKNDLFNLGILVNIMVDKFTQKLLKTYTLLNKPFNKKAQISNIFSTLTFCFFYTTLQIIHRNLKAPTVLPINSFK